MSSKKPFLGPKMPKNTYFHQKCTINAKKHRKPYIIGFVQTFPSFWNIFRTTFIKMRNSVVQKALLGPKNA